MTSPIERWSDHMKFTGAAPRTVETRVRMLRRVADKHGDPLTLTRADLTAFLARYEHASTRSTMLSYLRAFYGWAVREELLAADPTERIPSVKVPPGTPRPAAHQEVAAMLAAASPRTRSMALLMVHAGLRCFEVAAFRPGHLSRNVAGRWWVEVPNGKGGKRARVPIPGDVAEEILAGPTWDVTMQTVQKDVRAAFIAVGSEATPHMLRHYYGTAALQTTQNLRKVQDMMRHASPATTARYAQVSSEELSEAAEGLPRFPPAA